MSPRFAKHVVTHMSAAFTFAIDLALAYGFYRLMKWEGYDWSFTTILALFALSQLNIAYWREHYAKSF